jgi:hypothetical protein
LAAAALMLALSAALGLAGQPPEARVDDTFHDSHFHLTNDIQRGIGTRQFLQIMGTRVGRSTLFGIPLHAPLYYYSFTDAAIATAYRELTAQEQTRFDPMITGFNPADMYGVDHIRRVLTTFPGVFSGIGEFTIHQEFVSGKIAGATAGLTNPALDRILEFAAESGLVVLIHNDIGVSFATGDSDPLYLQQMTELLARHPGALIIWANAGLGRIVRPARASADTAQRSPAYVEIVEHLLANPALQHVHFDISWDEVARHAVALPETQARVAAMLNRYPDRFLFGTDSVAPSGADPYFAVFDMWGPVWPLLTPEASHKVRKGNYERIFDEGRRRVRAWERANVRW